MKKEHNKNILKLKTFKSRTPSLIKILLAHIKKRRRTGQTSRYVIDQMLIKRQKSKYIAVEIIQKIANQHYVKFRN